MGMTQRWWRLAPALTLALFASGCSDDDGNDTFGSDSAEYGTIQELAEDVCDPGTLEESSDGADYPCEIDGNRVLLTDWSTFGGAPEADGPGELSVDDVFGIQGPPAAIEVAKERMG